MGQMKEKNKIPEEKLSQMQIANLSDAEFKTLIIRMLRKLLEHSQKIKEEMKVTLSEIKNNPQVQINALEQKQEINISPEQKGKSTGNQ